MKVTIHRCKDLTRGVEEQINRKRDGSLFKPRERERDLFNAGPARRHKASDTVESSERSTSVCLLGRSMRSIEKCVMVGVTS